MQAMARLIVWKLPLHGAPTQGKVTLTSGGGNLNRYPGGQDVSFERISGHRDAGKTECPGNALYAQLPQLRSMVGNVQPVAPVGTQLSLSVAQPQLDYPATAALSGRLALPDSSPVPGGTVRIQLLGGLGWRTVALATTGGDGSWSASVPTGRSRVFRAVFPGDPAHTAARSAQLGVAVRPQLVAMLRRRAEGPARAGAVVVTGAVRPRKPRLRLFVERQAGRALRPFAPGDRRGRRALPDGRAPAATGALPAARRIPGRQDQRAGHSGAGVRAGGAPLSRASSVRVTAWGRLITRPEVKRTTRKPAMRSAASRWRSCSNAVGAQVGAAAPSVSAMRRWSGQRKSTSWPAACVLTSGRGRRQ